MYAVSKSESLNHSEEEVRHDGEEKKLCLCLGVAKLFVSQGCESNRKQVRIHEYKLRKHSLGED